MEIFDIIKEFIRPELLILVPVLYLIGICINNSEINNKFIPFILGGISIILTALYVLGTSDIKTAKEVIMAIFTSITQGVLLSGASVYFNQIYKQIIKKN